MIKVNFEAENTETFVTSQMNLSNAEDWKENNFEKRWSFPFDKCRSVKK